MSHLTRAAQPVGDHSADAKSFAVLAEALMFIVGRAGLFGCAFDVLIYGEKGCVKFGI